MIKKIKIIAYEYEIDVDKELGAKENVYAQHDASNIVIRLDEVTTRHDPEIHIMHEVFESLAWQLAIRDRKYDHDMLTALANAMCAVLKDNPNFTKMFLE